MKNLRVKYAGLDFKNPIVAVAGPLGRSFESLKASIKAGTSAVTLKSCNAKPKKKSSPRPGSHIFARPAHVFLRKYGLKDVMINWEGVPVEFTAEKEAEMIRRITPLANDHDCKIIANLHPDLMYLQDVDMLRRDLNILQDAEPDLFEICSCPYHYPPEMVMPEIQNYKLIKKNLKILFKILTDEISLPIIAKFNFPVFYHTHDLLNDFGIKNFHVTEGVNFYGTIVDIDSMEPIVPGPNVITYGKLRRPLMNLQTARTKNLGKNDVMSSGGVWTTNDCIERMLCGSQLVGLHTAIQSRGHKLFGEIIQGLHGYLDKKQIELEDVIGVAVPKIVSHEEHENFMRSLDLSKEEIEPIIDRTLCTGCGVCANCIHGGIQFGDNTPILNLDKCVRCGVCESLCPVNAIKLQETGVIQV